MPGAKKEIDTTNKFLVGMRGNDIVINRNPPGIMNKKDALNLAAWLVALSDTSLGHEDFDHVLEAVENT